MTWTPRQIEFSNAIDKILDEYRDVIGPNEEDENGRCIGPPIPGMWMLEGWCFMVSWHNIDEEKAIEQDAEWFSNRINRHGQNPLVSSGLMKVAEGFE